MAKDEKEARSLLRSDYPDCMNINQVRRDE